MTVVGEADGHFDPGDYVLFYGQKLRGDLLASKWITESNRWLTYGSWQPQFTAFMVEQYTDNNVYWLSVGTTPGLRMATQCRYAQWHGVHSRLLHGHGPRRTARLLADLDVYG